jgi:diacylglycerol O-acyltransferase
VIYGTSPRLDGVPDRLSPLDASFLFAEDRTRAMHVGAVMTFAPPESGEFDPEAFAALIGRRLGLVPRYRQKVREVPGHLGLPVWVDDPDFDLDYHVRRSALPRPGTDEQLRALVGRLIARRLDRSRPLWEIYLVEGLSDGRFAVVTKTHHAMVDGLASMDVGALLLDSTPDPRETADEEWRPAPEPSALELAADALVEAWLRPRTVLDVAARAGADVREVVAGVERAMATLVSATGGRPVHPLNTVTGEQRRFATARTTLADHRTVRAARGGTVNDVVLAVVAGALRRWMMTRGEPLPDGASVRALVPVSVRGRHDPGPALRKGGPAAAAKGGPAAAGKGGTAAVGKGGTAAVGNRISAYFVELPVGEADPLRRLEQVSAAMTAHKAGSQAVGATTLIRLAGLAPPTLHSLGIRLASQFSSQVYNVLVTNVPGPPRPLYALGARMLDMYPVVPLAGGQAVSIGITSYDGGMHYGLTADRDALPDVDVLAGALIDALVELVAAACPPS